MSDGEILPVRKMLSNIPDEHRLTDDTRLEWLWMQRVIVVQSIFMRSNNARDRMAASLVLQAAWSAHLGSIEMLIRRLEGGAVPDQVVQEGDSLPI
ncbi:hypothetical protein SEA_FEDE_54 [Microbacterium phage Fede]|nr:hypothetical protein SEA_FEDE_54 [Microbacterium phage Fede]